MEIRPLTPQIGAEIDGVDLSAATDGDIGALRKALIDHFVIFFREQSLDDEAQQQFAARFGEIVEFPFGEPGPPEAPDVHVIATGGGGPKYSNADTWHSDATFMSEPPLGSILRAVELPPLGGDTLWASAYAAYDSLSSRVQRLIEGMTATHVLAKSSSHRSPRDAPHPAPRRSTRLNTDRRDP